ncbi:MAG: hypothetical protein LUG16_05190 [Candidatus Gastranaerophilales bacterium]|nr:hypothetical protein [Candidatus Gastranaerophilales bacterium]
MNNNNNVHVNFNFGSAINKLNGKSDLYDYDFSFSGSNGVENTSIFEYETISKSDFIDALSLDSSSGMSEENLSVLYDVLASQYSDENGSLTNEGLELLASYGTAKGYSTRTNEIDTGDINAFVYDLQNYAKKNDIDINGDFTGTVGTANDNTETTTREEPERFGNNRNKEPDRGGFRDDGRNAPPERR